MRTLFVFELKKIWSRRMVWIVMTLSSLLILFTVGSPLLGSHFVGVEKVGSNYEEFLKDRTYQEALDGRAIDVDLILEMQDAYRKVPFEIEKYSLTDEYQKYARPYSAIYNYARQVTGLTGPEMVEWEASVADFYAMRMEKQERNWDSLLLTEIEKEYWRAREDAIEAPVVFRYAEGYYVLFSTAYTIGFLVLLGVAICLAGVFPEEHMRKTDQLILSSKRGRGECFRAKFLAGVLSAFLMSLALVLLTVITAFLLYGTDGYDAVFQLIYVNNSYPISVGEAVMINYLMVCLAGVFMGVLVMMFSEVFHSSIGSLAIAIGIILLPMFFSVPEEYRMLSQLWSYLPGDFVAGWSCFSMRTVTVFGKVFLPWQVVPALYSGLGLLSVLVTKRRFVKYQVSGR